MNIFTSLKSFSRLTFLGVLLPLSIMSCSNQHTSQAAPVIQSDIAHPDILPTVSKTISPSSSIQDKVNLYLQLLQAKDQPASAYANFISRNPAWPNQKVMLTLMQQALLNETDKNIIISICKNQPISLSSALVFCAEQTKTDPKLIKKARQAWIYSISLPNDEQAILSVFRKYFTANDQWNRFDHLESNGLTIAAARQINRLASTSQKQLAITRLAFRKRQLDAENTLGTLDKSQLQDPGLVYNRLKWLRLQKREDEAFNLWQHEGLQIEQNSGQKRFWMERETLSRSFININDIKHAYALLADPDCTTYSCKSDEIFLKGWITLRKLNNAERSVYYFKKLTLSASVLTKSRGYYWLGRAYQAQNNPSATRQAWQQAASYPTSFYGQLALATLSNISQQNILLHPKTITPIIQNALIKIIEPDFTKKQLDSLKNNELVQAAQILVQQNDFNHARSFLLAYNKLHHDITTQTMNAQLANQWSLPEDAVTLSRQAGSKGIILLKNGWPRPYMEQTGSILPTGMALAIMRQESSFNPIIVSHSHAYGLMQLLPSTAREMCNQNNISPKMGTPGNLVVPTNNIRLGTAYLSKLMNQFDHNLIYTIASYNAGPNRVKQWMENTPSMETEEDTIDWIEMIPFHETRNYVQRVMENMIIYQTDINK